MHERSCFTSVSTCVVSVVDWWCQWYTGLMTYGTCATRGARARVPPGLAGEGIRTVTDGGNGPLPLLLMARRGPQKEGTQNSS